MVKLTCSKTTNLPSAGLNYDASQVPPEWYGWLHHKTDYTPNKDPSKRKYEWMQKHMMNMSGTSMQYTPYSTTRSKIQPLKPPVVEQGDVCSKYDGEKQ